MRTILLKIFTVVLIAWLSFAFFSSQATAQTPWGGLHAINYTSLCDCSEAIWTWFTPLFIPTPTTGALTWYDAIGYPNYTINNDSGTLGQYTPGVPACWFYIYYTCYPMPAYGEIDYETGASNGS